MPKTGLGLRRLGFGNELDHDGLGLVVVLGRELELDGLLARGLNRHTLVQRAVLSRCEPSTGQRKDIEHDRRDLPAV